MWNPGLDPGRDRRDPTLHPRWEAGSHQGSRVGGGIPPWIPGGRRDPTKDPGWEAGSRLGSQVGGGIPPRIPGGRRDPTKDPGWEAGSRLGSRVGCGIPGWTPGGKGGIPPTVAGSRQSHLGSQVGLAGSHLNPACLFTWAAIGLHFLCYVCFSFKNNVRRNPKALYKGFERLSLLQALLAPKLNQLPPLKTIILIRLQMME